MDNYECMGYVVSALKELEHEEKEIRKVLAEMRYQFDMKTEEEAGKVYDNF